jgi:aryl-alcohol dehydrogenase-like predicted oxidoreductase
MKYNRLGNTGTLVSEACMGTMTFGGQADEATCASLFGMCLDRGVNFFDTANTYTASRSEQILGKLMEGKRDSLVIATKVFNATGRGPNDMGLSRKHILRACEDSLRRLKTDYIDLYQVHADDRGTPLHETLSALDDLVRAGKVRYIGASNHNTWRLCDALWTSQTRGLARYETLQPLYNLVERGLDAEMLPMCRDKGVGVIVWSPLAGGWLTGKYHGTEKPKGARLSGGDGLGLGITGTPDREKVMQALLAVSKQVGKSPAQIALRWVLDQQGITSVIMGASRVDQLEDNFGACDFKLDTEHWKALDRSSRLPIVYPAMIDRLMGQRRTAQIAALERK